VSTPLLDALRQDLKQAVRTLFKSPGFTIVAIASLAIGIAGNAAIFSVADAMFLRALPGIRDPDPISFGGAVALLSAVALFASVVPASVNPVEALRAE
jgi:hypothetical protein